MNLLSAKNGDDELDELVVVGHDERKLDVNDHAHLEKVDDGRSLLRLVFF